MGGVPGLGDLEGLVQYDEKAIGASVCRVDRAIVSTVL